MVNQILAKWHQIVDLLKIHYHLILDFNFWAPQLQRIKKFQSNHSKNPFLSFLIGFLFLTLQMANLWINQGSIFFKFILINVMERKDSIFLNLQQIKHHST